MLLKQITDISVVAGETIAVNDLLFRADSSHPYLFISGPTSGRAYKVISTQPGTKNARILGFALQAGNAGDTIQVRTSGTLGGLSGLSAGYLYGPSSTAGGITKIVAPTSLVQPLALAVSATEITVLVPYWRSVSLGYILGGAINGSASGVILRYSSSVNTFSSCIATLPPGARFWGANNQSSTKGYQEGGRDGGGSAKADINGISFATEVCVAVTNLSANYEGGPGVSSKTKGYVMFNTVTNALTFATETNANINKTPTNTYYRANAGSDVNSYWCGGSGLTAVIDRIVFSTETITKAIANLSEAKDLAGCRSSGLKLYALAGANAAGRTANVCGMPFSTETPAAATVLSYATQHAQGMSFPLGIYLCCGDNLSSIKLGQFYPFATETPTYANQWSSILVYNPTATN